MNKKMLLVVLLCAVVGNSYGMDSIKSVMAAARAEIASKEFTKEKCDAVVEAMRVVHAEESALYGTHTNIYERILAVIEGFKKLAQESGYAADLLASTFVDYDDRPCVASPYADLYQVVNKVTKSIKEKEVNQELVDSIFTAARDINAEYDISADWPKVFSHPSRMLVDLLVAFNDSTYSHDEANAFLGK